MIDVIEDTPRGEAEREDYLQAIARVRAGEQRAASELVARLRPIVIRIVRAHRPRRLAEEDLMQEVFLKMFTRLEQYRGDAPFEHWVSRIAVTTCVDQLRAQQCRPELRWADMSEGEIVAIEARGSEGRERWPGHALAARELVQTLLHRLKVEDRRVVVWFELEEKSIAEICQLTGWSFNLVKMRLFRARRKLQQAFRKLPGFDGHGRSVRTPAKLAPTIALRPLVRSFPGRAAA